MPLGDLVYGLSVGVRALLSARKPKRPIIARRPLFTSATSFFAFASSERFLVKPNGSNRLSGHGWTFALNVGK